MFEPYIQGGPGPETITAAGTDPRQGFYELVSGIRHGCGPGAGAPLPENETLIRRVCSRCGDVMYSVHGTICFACAEKSPGCGCVEPRHGCGPGEALPADTQTEGTRLPKRSTEELTLEFLALLQEHFSPFNWQWQQRKYQRLADLAGQIAGRTE